MWTNKGKTRVLGGFFRAENMPTNLYVALVTNAVVPAADTSIFDELAEIAAGNGYTAGGYKLALDGADFDTLTEDDANDRALVQIKDVTWTAGGGGIPDSGDGASYAVLLDDNGTVADREVLACWSLGVARSATDGQSITLQNLELRLGEMPD